MSDIEGTDAIAGFIDRFSRACGAFHELIEDLSYSDQAQLTGELVALVALAGTSAVLTPKAFVMLAANAANKAIRERENNAARWPLPSCFSSCAGCCATCARSEEPDGE